MNRLLIYVILFYALSTDLFGQKVNRSIMSDKEVSLFDEWVEGSVTFKDGQTMYCEFSYNPLVPEGMLKIKNNDKIITGTVYNVFSFSYYSNDSTFEHRYYSVPVSPNNRVFLEFIFDNSDFALYGHKSLKIGKYSGYYSYSSTSIEGIYQVYMFNKSSGKSFPITSKEFFTMMDDKYVAIRKFIKENKIKFKNSYDYIKVVNEYIRLNE